MSKKGQTELVGLVIIVIMITLGMLFLVIFSVGEKGEKKIFTRKNLASSTINALFETTVNEEGCFENIPFREIIKSCGKFQGGNSDQYSCEGKNSCEFLQEVFIKKLLAETLGEWKKCYEFKSGLAGEEPLIKVSNAPEGQRCSGDRDPSSIPLTIPDVGLMESTLFIYN